MRHIAKHISWWDSPKDGEAFTWCFVPIEDLDPSQRLLIVSSDRYLKLLAEGLMRPEICEDCAIEMLAVLIAYAPQRVVDEANVKALALIEDCRG